MVWGGPGGRPVYGSLLCYRAAEPANADVASSEEWNSIVARAAREARAFRLRAVYVVRGGKARQR